MSGAIRPSIAIKAGRCVPKDSDPKKIVPSPEPGILYLYNNPEDELLHLCWKPRSSPDAPVDDLLIIPYDATFVPYPINSGRVYVLKFSSSSQRHFYYLQSKPERANEPGHFSNRDKEYGRRINKLLQGEEGDDEDLLMDDEDATMEDVERGADGADAREGGADGGRATTTSAAQSSLPANTPGTDASSNDFLRNLVSSISVPPSSGPSTTRTRSNEPPLSLPILLASSTTVPILPSMSTAQINNLVSLLPPGLIEDSASDAEKRRALEKVLRSPQFSQALGVLNEALRDEGGIRGVCDSLGVDISVVAAETRKNGGDLVGGYVEGVRKQVEKEDEDKDKMQE